MNISTKTKPRGTAKNLRTWELCDLIDRPTYCTGCAAQHHPPLCNVMNWDAVRLPLIWQNWAAPSLIMGSAHFGIHVQTPLLKISWFCHLALHISFHHILFTSTQTSYFYSPHLSLLISTIFSNTHSCKKEKCSSVLRARPLVVTQSHSRWPWIWNSACMLSST